MNKRNMKTNKKKGKVCSGCLGVNGCMCALKPNKLNKSTKQRLVRCNFVSGLMVGEGKELEQFLADELSKQKQEIIEKLEKMKIKKGLTEYFVDYHLGYHDDPRDDVKRLLESYNKILANKLRGGDENES